MRTIYKQSKARTNKKEFKVGRKNPNLFQHRFNIAPSQMIDVVFEPETERILSQLKWDLVPVWAKDVEIGNRMIKARADAIREKRNRQS